MNCKNTRTDALFHDGPTASDIYTLTCSTYVDKARITKITSEDISDRAHTEDGQLVRVNDTLFHTCMHELPAMEGNVDV